MFWRTVLEDWKIQTTTMTMNSCTAWKRVSRPCEQGFLSLMSVTKTTEIRRRHLQSSSLRNPSFLTTQRTRISCPSQWRVSTSQIEVHKTASILGADMSQTQRGVTERTLVQLRTSWRFPSSSASNPSHRQRILRAVRETASDPSEHSINWLKNTKLSKCKTTTRMQTTSWISSRPGMRRKCRLFWSLTKYTSARWTRTSRRSLHFQLFQWSKSSHHIQCPDRAKDDVVRTTRTSRSIRRKNF